MSEVILKCAANFDRGTKVVIREPQGKDPAGRPIVEVTIGGASGIIPLAPGQARELADCLMALADKFEQ